MSQVYNIYCDESCHLENDRQKAMVLGAVWCPTIKTSAAIEYIVIHELLHSHHKWAAGETHANERSSYSAAAIAAYLKADKFIMMTDA